MVQEALTNVIKHAGPVATTVSLAYASDHLSVVVANERSAVTRRAGNGLGLIGMRERVELVGGRLEAGPRHEGGFQVLAGIPAA